VIIFIPPGQKERVVHRVVSTGPEGVRTQGDANPCRDTGELRQKDIVGRAVSVERNRMVLPVASGLAGHMLAAFIRALRMSDHLASHVLHPCYRGLAEAGFSGYSFLPPCARGLSPSSATAQGRCSLYWKAHHRAAPCRRRRVDHRAALPIFVDEQTLP